MQIVLLFVVRWLSWVYLGLVQSDSNIPVCSFCNTDFISTRFTHGMVTVHKCFLFFQRLSASSGKFNESIKYGGKWLIYYAYAQKVVLHIWNVWHPIFILLELPIIQLIAFSQVNSNRTWHQFEYQTSVCLLPAKNSVFLFVRLCIYSLWKAFNYFCILIVFCMHYELVM